MGSLQPPLLRDDHELWLSENSESKRNFGESINYLCGSMDRLLVAFKPTGQGDYEEVEGLYDMGHCTHRLSVILSDNNIIRLVRIFAPYAPNANS